MDYLSTSYVFIGLTLSTDYSVWTERLTVLGRSYLVHAGTGRRGLMVLQGTNTAKLGKPAVHHTVVGSS